MIEVRDKQKNEIVDIDNIDYLEMYVSNAKQSAFYFCKLFGFKVEYFSGLETGNREYTSYILTNNSVKLILTSAHRPEHAISRFIRKRGDSIKDIALSVKNIEQVYENIIKNGGVSLEEPREIIDKWGTVKIAKIGTLGEIVHTLIERTNYNNVSLPGFELVTTSVQHVDTGLLGYDHIAICVPEYKKYTNYYESIFGFNLLKEFSKDEISSKKTSLMTKVIQNGSERIKFVFVEPAKNKKKSQIEEFLKYNDGPGVQHVAFLTNDIIKTVQMLQNNGTNFLYTPDDYYQIIPKIVGDIEESYIDLQKLKILIDKDDEGYLLQIFAHPIQDRPTLFFEIIQRKGSRGFGNGNIKALFESVEREQEKRGNL